MKRYFNKFWLWRRVWSILEIKKDWYLWFWHFHLIKGIRDLASYDYSWKFCCIKIVATMNKYVTAKLTFNMNKIHATFYFRLRYTQSCIQLAFQGITKNGWATIRIPWIVLLWTYSFIMWESQCNDNRWWHQWPKFKHRIAFKYWYVYYSYRLFNSTY